ncbi:MAG: hypothetical protein JSV12_05650 [Candidatus Bathyarchaeota archaeon]|nr:MAG: hypothetical protein JSV12_05650 [Candidatus Bathyarchaeota archaeon]
MDWGIVVSVLVANIIFVLALAAIVLVFFGLAARGIKKEMEAGGTPKCPMPMCPFHEDIESARKTAESGE